MIAYDGISVVVNSANDFVDSLTVEELNALWKPDSTVETWQDLRPEWPNEKIALYGPGTDSGTFDYFTEAINGKSGESRTDFVPSEDDNVLVQGIAGDKNALGFFGLRTTLKTPTSSKPCRLTAETALWLPASNPLRMARIPVIMPNIACISDIHGNLLALKSVLADIRRIGCGTILCAGDLVGYGPFPNDVVDEIRSQSIQTVMGNYDEAVGFKLPVCGCHIDDTVQKRYSDHALKWAIDHTSAQSREFLRSLPEQLSLDICGQKLLIVHASTDSINEYIYATDEDRIADLLSSVEEDIYVYGHTHFPYIKKERAS